MSDTPTVGDALDGKLDMIRRFTVDVKALTERTTPHAVSGNSMVMEMRGPSTAGELRELQYDAAQIKHAECFAWAERIGQMVHASTKTFPVDAPFSPDWLYTRSGIWWFGRESRLLRLQSTEGDVTGGIQRRVGCALSFWPQFNRPENTCLWAYSYDHLEPTSGPVPITNVILKPGDTFASLMTAWMEEHARGRVVVDQLVATVPPDPREGSEKAQQLYQLDVVHLKRGYESGIISKSDLAMALRWLRKLAWIRSAEQVMKFFFAGSLWIQQRVLVTGEGHAPRVTRRRAERASVEARVQVVELRRRAYVSPPGTEGHAEVEWSCSWVVCGHWRNQFYPSTETHKPIWIDPHVKGDPEKPMRHAERVFSVRR